MKDSRSLQNGQRDADDAFGGAALGNLESFGRAFDRSVWPERLSGLLQKQRRAALLHVGHRLWVAGRPFGFKQKQPDAALQKEIADSQHRLAIEKAIHFPGRQCLGKTQYIPVDGSMFGATNHLLKLLLWFFPKQCVHTMGFLR